MLKIKLKFLKLKWFFKYKKEILNNTMSYHDKPLSEIFGFDEKTDIFCITLYDTINNSEANKLIKKLYKLKKKKIYDVDVIYRKKMIKNINYIKPQFDYTGNGGLAKIKFLKDDLISSIEMSWSQINNDEAVVQYVCNIKQGIDNFNRIHKFIIEEYKGLYFSKYSTFYFSTENFINDENQNLQTELRYFRSLIQWKIQKVGYSHYLKKYLLPIKYCYLVDKKTKKIMNYIKKPFLEESYIVDSEHYLILNNLENYEGAEISEIIFKKRFNPFDMVTLLSRLRMPLYYKIFYNIEKAELESRITKYLNSKKLLVNFFEYKWLLNKRRKIDEKRFYKINNIKENRIKGYSSKENNLIENDMYEGIKAVYDENIDYIKNINSLNYNILAFAVSILALVIAIVGIFL